MGSLWRRLLLSIRFGSYRILLSPEITPDSRVLFHRQIGERVRRIAPFFRFDADPYFVIRADGRLAWLLDGYTATDRYPYAERVPGLGNYVRNSVKVVVDAYDGTVRFYVSDAQDPIVRAYAAAFPGLLEPIEAMPADLRAHVRYPAGFFAVQARMYATYHMQDPRVFYNKEDLWSVPRMAEGGRDREIDPYYTIMRIPGESREEFVLLMPFTPLRRDNMIAWLAARSDGPAYGRLVAFLFPKQRLVFGPRQIGARIDQDAVISQQLTLWSQRGSTVIRGSLLAIPVEESLLYVQPLYLAAEKGSIPELKRVIVAHGNQIAMGETLDAALQAIFGGRPGAPAEPARPSHAGEARRLEGRHRAGRPGLGGMEPGPGRPPAGRLDRLRRSPAPARGRAPRPPRARAPLTTRRAGLRRSSRSPAARARLRPRPPAQVRARK